MIRFGFYKLLGFYVKFFTVRMLSLNFGIILTYYIFV